MEIAILILKNLPLLIGVLRDLLGLFKRGDETKQFTVVTPTSVKSVSIPSSYSAKKATVATMTHIPDTGPPPAVGPPLDYPGGAAQFQRDIERMHQLARGEA